MKRERVYVLMMFFLGIYIILFFVFGYIQMVRGPSLTKEAIALHSQGIGLKETARGEIFDRHLMYLTGGHEAVGLYCLPQVLLAGVEKEDGLQVIKDYSEGIGNVLQISPEQIYKEMEVGCFKSQGWFRFSFVLSQEQANRINIQGIKGLITYPVYRRYDEQGFCSHLLGYVNGEAFPAGASGIEEKYNDILKENQQSDQLVTIFDARGIPIEGLVVKLQRQQNQSAGSVVLTIDKRIQKIVEQAMDKHIQKGAVVVMDVETREILAMASRPNFSPYKVADISTAEGAPLYNRALIGYYPGSLFKILLTAVALEEGLVRPDEMFSCHGAVAVDEGMSVSCWQKEGQGNLTLAQAFALSCNPAFIEIGQRCGREKIIAYARQMHLLDHDIIGFNGMQQGGQLFINPGRRALANASLGQEGVMLTPLQLCSLIATVAGGGQWRSPSLLRYCVDKEGRQFDPETMEAIQVIKPETAQMVRNFMTETVKSGTGKPAGLLEVQAAGKTGTSQTGGLDENGIEVLNAWFGGFYPADQPRWAIVVLAEQGISGAQDAAPVFKDIAAHMVNDLGMTQ